MLCQNCGKNPATTHVKKTVNGETSELYLCASCAAQQGLGNMWKGFGFDLGDFWGNLFAEPSVRAQADSVRCDGCGKTFNEIVKSGRAGCPSCYTTFYYRLLPSDPADTRQDQAIPGKIPPQGERPGKASAGSGSWNSSESSWCDAIQRVRNTSPAAVLRDQIKESGGGEP